MVGQPKSHKSPAMQGFFGREPKGFPGDSVVKNPTANARDVADGFSPRIGEIPWSGEWLLTPVFVPGESSWTEEPDGL